MTTKGNGFQQGPPCPWACCVVRLLIAPSNACCKYLGMMRSQCASNVNLKFHIAGYKGEKEVGQPLTRL